MEIVTSVMGKIVEKIVDNLFNATVCQFGYLCKYKHNIEALEKELKKLPVRKNDLQAEIDAAERDGKPIKGEVQSWIEEVEHISAAAEKFMEDEVKANKRCLRGWCINLSLRYKLGKEAKAKTLAISALIGVGGSFGKDVSLPAPPPPIISLSEGFNAFKSRESIMEQIMEFLKDENISIIGICGMGGVGKTTLVKEIQKQAKEKKMFDEVAMAVVSQPPSIIKIQDEITGWLGFKDLPGINNSTRASSLMSRVQKARRVLIILDDLWERIELSDVGVPYGKDHKGCKILLTSRSHGVCNQMGAHKIFVVGTLTKEESWSLFREVAGPKVDNPEINPTAREIADECGGLPIAILTVGRALKGMDSHVWKDANEQLKKSSPTNIEGMQEHVLSRVELSYKYLKSEEAKSIFLLCSCFPEDFKISIEVLARYGMGLMCFHNIDSMEKARGRARSLVSTLVFSFLLINGDEEGYVKMHDVVRDAAQQIATKNDYMIKAGVELKDWPNRDTYKDLKWISLMGNDINEVPDGLEMECPNLQALFLQGNKRSKIPNNFFHGMKDLKVLDLSNKNLSSMPPSLSFLSNLRTLCLCQCEFRDNLCLIGELVRLEIIDLSESNVKKIPINFGQLSHLRLLDLTGCRNLTIIPRGVISRLCKLEELYMSGSYSCWDWESEGDSRRNTKELYMSESFSCWDWESEGDSRRNNVRLIELHALSRLTNLHIFIPEGNLLPPDMPSANLTSFSISIGYNVNNLIDIFFKKFNKRCLRALSLSHDMKISVLHAWIKILIIKSEILVLNRIMSVENLLVDLVNEGFNELKFLTINDCKKMKYLFNTLKRAPRVTFHRLEWLAIYSNPNLLEICHGQLPDRYFCNVKRLGVGICEKVLNILPGHLLKSFQNLEYFEVFSCKSLAYVFEFEELEIAEDETELCSSLMELDLWNLPRMIHIWKGDAQFVSLHNLKSINLCRCKELGKVLFPATLVQSLVHLERVNVTRCSKLEEIFGREAAEDLEKVWKRERIHATPSLALGNLVYIHIEGCGELRCLLTTSMVKSLVQLRSLFVKYCPTLKEIITVAYDGEKEEMGPSTKKITFPSLIYLTLTSLDSLSCFCSGLYNIEFPALEDLTITECPSMETFGYGQVQVMTPKLMHLHFDDKKYRWKGDLNDTIQHIFNRKEKATDSSAKTSLLAGRPSGPYASPIIPTDSDDAISYQAIGGVMGETLEQNSQLFDQISANFATLNVRNNIDLLCKARDNLHLIINKMNDMPGIMKRMPPLPVKVNDEIINLILPRPSHQMNS